MAGNTRQYERPVTGRGPKAVALAVALALCVALPVLALVWMGARPYEPPRAEAAAVEGEPKPPAAASFGYGGAETADGFRVGLASRWVVDEDGRLPIWFANPQGNEARLLVRICRASDQEVLFESGVLSPGTYVERLEPLVKLDARPVEAEAAIYSFDEDYLSLGTLRLQGTIE